MRSKITTVVILLAVCTLATGCKIRIEVGEGGHVESKSGQYYCEENSACVVDVVDYLFFEEFVAVPNEGQVFFGWKEGARAWTVANFEQIALHRLCPGLCTCSRASATRRPPHTA